MLGALEVARQSAEDAGRIKSNFLRMMSHELRTPITAMELQLRLIERRSGPRMPGDVREGFDRIGRSSKRLCHLVDTVLAWARVESGRCQLDVGRVDITALAREATTEVEGYARQKGITIEVRADRDATRLATDRKLVRLLVVNLVGRAVQVTESGSVIVEVREHSSGGLVAVSDRGTPIGPEEREASYSPLSVVGDFHRRSGAGSGLDLHVVRDIARAVEGDLAIESSAVGNTLTLFLGELPQDHVTGERPMLPERDLRSG
jgi:signal transduction histidine kinase